MFNMRATGQRGRRQSTEVTWLARPCAEPARAREGAANKVKGTCAHKQHAEPMSRRGNLVPERYGIDAARRTS